VGAVLMARWPGFEGLRARPLLARVLANLGWQTADRVLKVGLGLVVAIALARHLGPAGFGQYSLVLAFVGVVSGLATLGLPQVVVRSLVRSQVRAQVRSLGRESGDGAAAGPGPAQAELLGTAAALVLAGATLAWLLALGAAAWARPGDADTLLGVAVVGATLVLQVSSVVRWGFEARVAVQPVVVVESVVGVAGALLKLALIAAGAPLPVFFAVLLAEAAVLTVALAVLQARRGGGFGGWRVRAGRVRELLLASWPLALSGVVLMLQARLDQLLLARLAGDAELGQYGVALRLAEGLVFGAAVLSSTLFPVLVAARRESFAAFHLRLLHAYRACIAAALVVSLPLALLAPWLVPALFGPAYEPAGLLLTLMAGRVFLAFVGTARSLFLLVEDLQRWATVTLVVGTLLNLLLNLWWIPQHGATGAVWASLVSFGVTTFVVDLLHPRARGNVADLFRAGFTLARLRQV
jgi:O-antigen/teichoic acid export membrane protein